MKLKLDLHDIYNRGGDIDRALQAIIDEAVAKKAPMIEIIPARDPASSRSTCCASSSEGNQGQYHRVEKDSKNFGRLFVHFRW